MVGWLLSNVVLGIQCDYKLLHPILFWPPHPWHQDTGNKLTDKVKRNYYLQQATINSTGVKLF